VRIQAHNGPWPLHNAAASRRLETRALAEAEPGALMARAGLSVARLALALVPHARRVQVWCGPGNNGGDGLVAARHLLQAGLQVDVRLLADEARLPADSLAALAQARAAGLAVHVAQAMRVEPGAVPHLVIDALLGLGASRPPQGDLAAAIAHINGQQSPVLAVDIPSGLHPDTGSRLGEQAVVAQHTLSLLSLKPGCFTHQGRDHSGQVWLDDLGVQGIGAVDGTQPTACLGSMPAALQHPHASHKGSQGDVAVVGGAPGMEGAAWLAASAALAAGAGRVYGCLLGDIAALPAHRPELMWRSRWWLLPPQVLAGSTVACGCGGGDAVRQALPALLSHAARLVL
ncbi:MAG: NAD(P)H-hydrate epimerase, partial [Rubrivivax sp.]